MLYEIKEGQSAVDLSIQFGYGIDKIVSFLQQSKIDGFSQNEISGKEINVLFIKNKVSDLLILTGRYLTSKSTEIITVSGDSRITEDEIERSTEDNDIRIIE